ncbi:hypothetical protein [Streptomyces sp. TR06-5]|uniref:hypothetical protein n=1 Tax=unclassified Streptomyces TaxID=2593676 RepID=UPI0039A2EE6C
MSDHDRSRFAEDGIELVTGYGPEVLAFECYCAADWRSDVSQRQVEGVPELVERDLERFVGHVLIMSVWDLGAT